VLALPFSFREPIVAPSIQLRSFRDDDKSTLKNLQQLPGIANYLLWEVPDDAEVDERLARKITATQLNERDDQLCLVIEDRTTQAMIGECSLFLTDPENATVELGYIVHPEFQNRGIAKETVRVLVDLAFGPIRAHRVIGRIDARNGASASVLRSVGMRQEAHFLRDQYVKGQWTDEMVFAMLASEWTHKQTDCRS
jgi:RimJ/RimL family protein N-acetyltransferase